MSDRIGGFHKTVGTLGFAGFVEASAEGVTITSNDSCTYSPEEARKLAYLLMRGAERSMDLRRARGL